MVKRYMGSILRNPKPLGVTARTTTKKTIESKYVFVYESIAYIGLYIQLSRYDMLEFFLVMS